MADRYNTEPVIDVRRGTRACTVGLNYKESLGIYTYIYVYIHMHIHIYCHKYIFCQRRYLKYKVASVV